MFVVRFSSNRGFWQKSRFIRGLRCHLEIWRERILISSSIHDLWDLRPEMMWVPPQATIYSSIVLGCSVLLCSYATTYLIGSTQNRGRTSTINGQRQEVIINASNAKILKSSSPKIVDWLKLLKLLYLCFSFYCCVHTVVGNHHGNDEHHSPSPGQIHTFFFLH